MTHTRFTNLLTQTLVWGTVLIILYIPFHAFFSVSLGVVSGQPLLVKAWKEGLLLLLICIGGLLLWRRDEVRHAFIQSRLNQIAMIFVLLHAMLALFLHGSFLTTMAGLAIDTRYVLFFLLVRLAVLCASQVMEYMVRAFVVSAVFVIGFGVLQQYVLPADVLSAVGYSKATIAPYLTVDNNPAFIRINSTLRGPNPLGAYAMIGVMTALGWLAVGRRRYWLLALFGLPASLSVLYASYSRSAWIAAVISVGIWVFLSLSKRWRLAASGGLIAGLIVLVGVYSLNQNSSFVQNIIIHNDPANANNTDSNEGHLTSVQQASEVATKLPFGGGIGSTGSASLLGDTPLIVENQYLFVAHEAGWIGLGIFIVLVAGVVRGLWLARANWLARVWLASGVGLLIIGLLLPVFTDDTVAYLWWGLAAALLPVTIKAKATNKIKT